MLEIWSSIFRRNLAFAGFCVAGITACTKQVPLPPPGITPADEVAIWRAALKYPIDQQYQVLKKMVIGLPDGNTTSNNSAPLYLVCKTTIPIDVPKNDLVDQLGRGLRFIGNVEDERAVLTELLGSQSSAMEEARIPDGAVDGDSIVAVDSETLRNLLEPMNEVTRIENTNVARWPNAFEKRFPNTDRVVRLSRVVAARNFAYVITKSDCGRDCAASTLTLLQKQSSGWVVRGVLLLGTT